MSTKSKELAELPFTRLSYEVVVLSLELSSASKDSLFSLELSKGSLIIETNRKFTIDELTVNETFCFFQDQGGTLGARGKLVEVRLLMWRGNKYAVVATYKLDLQVCTCKSSKAPFYFDNGDQVVSKMFYSVNCMKHIVNIEEEEPLETQAHGVIESPKVERKDRDHSKIGKNTKTQQNQQSKSTGKSSGNKRNSSQEQDLKAKQQEQLRAATKGSADHNQHTSPEKASDCKKKIEQEKKPVNFTSFWRINIDRSQTPRPQTERNHASDTHQIHQTEKQSDQTQREQKSSQNKQNRRALTPQPKCTKTNTASTQQQIVQPLKQQQKVNQHQEEKQSSQTRKDQPTQRYHKSTRVYFQAEDQSKEQRQAVTTKILEAKQSEGVLAATQKQLRKDISNTTKNKDNIECVTQKVKLTTKIIDSNEPKDKKKKIAASIINTNVFLTPKTKIPTPTQLPKCGSSQYSSESSMKNSFFSDQSSCKHVPSNAKQEKKDRKRNESTNKQDTQRRQRDQQTKIHKDIISQLIGETPESKGEKKQQKGVTVSEEMKRKIKQLSQNGHIVINDEEEKEQAAILIGKREFKNEIDTHNQTTDQTQEKQYQTHSLTRITDYNRKKLNEIEQLDAMISQMKLEGEQQTSEAQRHNDTARNAEQELIQPHLESHIDVEDKVIPSEGETAEEGDSPEKEKKRQAQEILQDNHEYQKRKMENGNRSNNSQNTDPLQKRSEKNKQEMNTARLSAELSLAKHALLLSQQEKQLMSQQIDILRQQNTDLQSQVQSAAHSYIHALNSSSKFSDYQQKEQKYQGQLQSENAALALRFQSSMRSCISQPAADKENALKMLTEQNSQLRKEQIEHLERIQQQKDEIERLNREIQERKMEVFIKLTENEEIQQQQQSASSMQSAQTIGLIEEKNNTQNPSLQGNLIIDEFQSKLAKLNLEFESATSKITDLQQHLFLCQSENQKLHAEISILKNQLPTFENNTISFEDLTDQQQQQLIQAQLQQSFQSQQQNQQQIQQSAAIIESSTQQQIQEQKQLQELPLNLQQNNTNNDTNIQGNSNNSSELQTLKEQSKKSELNLKLNKELMVQKQQELDKLQNLYSLYYKKAHNLESINQNLEFELLQTKQDFCEALNVTFEKGGNDLLDIIERNVSFREYKPKVSEFR